MEEIAVLTLLPAGFQISYYAFFPEITGALRDPRYYAIRRTSTLLHSFLEYPNRMRGTRQPSSPARTAVLHPPRPPAPFATGAPRLRATQEPALPSPGHPPSARENLFASPRSARGCRRPRSPQPGCRRPGLRERYSGRCRPGRGR